MRFSNSEQHKHQLLQGSSKFILTIFCMVILTGLTYGCKSSGNHSGNQPIAADTLKTEKPEQKQILPNTAYELENSNSGKLSLPNNRGAVTYRLTKAVVKPKNATEKQLVLSIRAIFEGIGQGAFWEENFLLAIENGDVLNANNPTKDMVNPNKIYNKDISFTIPVEETKVMLIIMGLNGKSATLNLDLSKIKQ